MLDGKLPEGRIHVWQMCGEKKTHQMREKQQQERNQLEAREKGKSRSLWLQSLGLSSASHTSSHVCVYVCSAVSNSVCVWIQLCPTLCECVQLCAILCNPMDCSLPGFSVYRFFQARSTLPFPIPGGSSRPRDPTGVSCISRRVLYY